MVANDGNESGMARRNLSSFIAILTLTIAGCGGSGDGAQRGVFLDAAAVEGLRYQTATRSGVTDADGAFRYLPGEQVTFYVGEMEIGRVAGTERVTPFDLAGVNAPDGEVDLEVLRPVGRGLNKAINLATFLQTIDEDGDLSNGIVVPQRLRSMQARSPVQFALPALTFREHPTLRTYMGQARAAGVWGGSRPIKHSGYAADALYRGLGFVSAPQARSEFRMKSTGLADVVTSYSYDEKGHLIEEVLVDPPSDVYQKTVTAYDDAGNRIRVSTYLSPDTLLNEIFYSYDANGNEIRAETIQSGLSRWVMETRRDISGNPVEIAHFDLGAPTWRAVHSYDDLGRPVKSEYYDGSGQLTGGSESDYGADFLQTATRYFDATRTLSMTAQMRYDENGEVIQEFLYDSVDQLIGAYHGTRDSNGNLLREEQKDGAGLTVSATTIEYDATGRRRGLKIYDSTSALTGIHVLSYDPKGRLVSTRIDDISNGVIIDQITTYKPVKGWASFFAGFDRGPR